MAHKTLIDGTAYTVSGGRTLADGTSYNVKNGKVLVDGTAYDISFVKPLENCTWAEISAISQSGKASDYWSVGDTKSVYLNGNIGRLSVDTTLYVYILGFNHNSTIEGNGITFGTFKTANGKDVCLIDSAYGSSSTSSTKQFNMNHGEASNEGGWKSCDLRYDILGSTNTRSDHAGTTTATSPVSNTLMAALPGDLRAVMRPITKYTDNVAGEDATSKQSNVTATIDYLPLMSEFELNGVRQYANYNEQNYQQQYAYFSAGNSTAKYRHSSTGSAARYWTRSPCIYDSGGKYFVCNTFYYNASYMYGISPVFLV